MACSDEKTEYQEGNRIAMNYLQMTLMAGSIFISTSFAIFGLSFTVQKPTCGALLMMGMSSILLYSVFLIYDKRYTRYAQIIFPMLRGIEQKNLTTKFHTAIDLADHNWEKACRFNYHLMRIGIWNRLGFVALVVLWVIRIIFFKALQ